MVKKVSLLQAQRYSIRFLAMDSSEQEVDYRVGTSPQTLLPAVDVCLSQWAEANPGYKFIAIERGLGAPTASRIVGQPKETVRDDLFKLMDPFTGRKLGDSNDS